MGVPASFVFVQCTRTIETDNPTVPQIIYAQTSILGMQFGEFVCEPIYIIKINFYF
jgi:hypothetical protein